MWEGIKITYFAYRSHLHAYVHYLYFEEAIYKEKTLKSITIPGRMFPFSFSSFSFAVSVCSVAESLPSKYWQHCRSGRLFPQRLTLKEVGPHAGAALSHSTHRGMSVCSAQFLGKLRSANFASKQVLRHQMLSSTRARKRTRCSNPSQPSRSQCSLPPFMVPSFSHHTSCFPQSDAVLLHPLSAA